MLERREEGEEGEKHGRTSDSFLHRTGNKRSDRLKGQDAGRESEEEKEGGAVTKMLRGPYSHSHGAQRAAIKLHYQTGRLWGGPAQTHGDESSCPLWKQEAESHRKDKTGRPLIAVNTNAGRLIILPRQTTLGGGVQVLAEISLCAALTRV